MKRRNSRHESRTFPPTLQQRHIVHLLIIKNNVKLWQQLTSRKFRDQCTLQLAGVWVKRNITVDGKKKVIREFFTMEDYKLNQEHPENNNQGG